MLTCSVAAAAVAACRYTVINSLHLKNFQPPSLSSISSKYHLISLKKCVHKLTTQQRSFLSFNSCPSLVEVRRYRHSIPSFYFHQPPFTRTKTNTSHCCLLNLNHHISFNYINSSIILNHRCFHQSFVVTSAIGESEATNGSIHDNVIEDSLNSKLELSTGDKVRFVEVGLENDEENEEVLKQHIWDTGPAVLPTFNVGAYANESDNAKKLIQLGVNLSEWEGRYGTIPLLYKADFDKQMKPIISFLKNIGVEGTDLGNLLTVNPFIFNEDVRNLEKRVEYMRLKNFSDEAIINIVSKNPYWLSFSVPRIDRRLGFFQTYFNLTGDQVRRLANAGSSGPKLITYHLPRVKDVTFTIKEEMGFTSEEIVKLLLARPKIWRQIPVGLRRLFDYLHNEEKFSHDEFIRYPLLLLQRERRMRERIGFLKSLGCAQFDPTKPNYISFEMLCEGNDAAFAVNTAKVGVVEYNNYLKTL